MKIVKNGSNTYYIGGVVVDMMTYDEKYIKIRSNFKRKLNKCLVCNHKFEIGEKVSLALCAPANKVLCHNCAIEIQKQLKGELEEGKK